MQVTGRNIISLPQPLSGYIFFLLNSALVAGAAQVQLAWNPSPDPGVIGYALYYGSASGYYTNRVEAGNQTATSVTNLTAGIRYYFAVTAYNLLGMESLPSNETSCILSPATSTNSPPYISKFSVSAQGASLTWTSLPGRSYRVVYKDSLPDPQWRTASPDLNCTNAVTSWVDPVTGTGGQRFYAVVLLP